MADVIKMGRYTAIPGEPIPELVDKLEDLLAQAKSGELRGMAYTLIYTPEGAPLPIIKTGWWGPMMRDALAHGIMLLKHHWIDAMNRDVD